jgi:hypothetical protein
LDQTIGPLHPVRPRSCSLGPRGVAAWPKLEIRGTVRSSSKLYHRPPVHQHPPISISNPISHPPTLPQTPPVASPPHNTLSKWTSMSCTRPRLPPVAANPAARLSQNEARELQNRMEKKQMKEFMNVSRPALDPHPSPVAELTCPPADVLEPRPAVLRLVRQRLREQVAHLARGGLRHAVRRQAHEGLPATGRPVPGAERCHGTAGRHAWPINRRAAPCISMYL